MTAKVHLPTPDTAGDWHLARHYHANSPQKQGSCIGLPRQFAPPPDVLEPSDDPDTVLPERPGKPHPAYVGVFLETRKPRRYYYAVLLPGGREVKGYGFLSPAKAAQAYDRVCREQGVHLDVLNFGREDKAG